MSMDVNEKDWKLFRKNLPDWQENYMEKLIKEYVDFLKGDGLASGKFWELEKKIKKDKKNPGVLLQDVRRSNFHMHLASLVRCEVISMKDLEGFSYETKEIIERMLR
ncbi:multidrug transporter [Butyrivibrio sp.]|uniref:multidrug transporter n=1 Tax=Butyrivibrio sp. TaxID=28121 RepID=UPI0025BA6768|nr:multidrug transporter [Butyrivibrio sp.]